MNRSKDIYNSTWDVTLHDMKTKLKQTSVRIHLQIFRMKIILKMLKDHPKNVACK
jgi:hypothetical protein